MKIMQMPIWLGLSKLDAFFFKFWIIFEMPARYLKIGIFFIVITFPYHKILWSIYDCLIPFFYVKSNIIFVLHEANIIFVYLLNPKLVISSTQVHMALKNYLSGSKCFSSSLSLQ